MVTWTRNRIRCHINECNLFSYCTLLAVGHASELKSHANGFSFDSFELCARNDLVTQNAYYSYKISYVVLHNVEDRNAVNKSTDKFNLQTGNKASHATDTNQTSRCQPNFSVIILFKMVMRLKTLALIISYGQELYHTGKQSACGQSKIN